MAEQYVFEDFGKIESVVFRLAKKQKFPVNFRQLTLTDVNGIEMAIDDEDVEEPKQKQVNFTVDARPGEIYELLNKQLVINSAHDNNRKPYLKINGIALVMSDGSIHMFATGKRRLYIGTCYPHSEESGYLRFTSEPSWFASSDTYSEESESDNKNIHLHFVNDEDAEEDAEEEDVRSFYEDEDDVPLF